ncbi:MAG: tRNA (guanosine(37)-N1)-methyltransferase TrmD, partial [Gammaproteobacteria bacterium]|nr:tRNA (guanosine(37)-N1)-methyltransferase TrmD [Gammaproteobacteria bacterium]
VDDRPFGGGPGMLLKVEPLKKAITQANSKQNGHVVYLSPQGKKMDHKTAIRLSDYDHLILLAGRYEGIDERSMQYIDEEISIGDFTLSGGEIPAMAIIDSVARLLPGTLGDKDSAIEDSFVSGLLDHPQYTRPEEFEGHKVPEVLLCGDHKKIELWRLQQRLGNTWLKRPDLLDKLELSEKELKLLQTFKNELKI